MKALDPLSGARKPCSVTCGYSQHFQSVFLYFSEFKMQYINLYLRERGGGEREWASTQLMAMILNHLKNCCWDITALTQRHTAKS